MKTENSESAKLDIPNMGLVLEGGAMRGVFTCGVLDWLMDNGVRFPYVIGVSAGACNGASYVSGQLGRARYSNIELLKEHKYIGIKHFIKKRNFIDFDLLFEDFPKRILPFDFDAFGTSNTKFEMVATNCNTGEAEYLEGYDSHDQLLQALRASSSMPLASPVCYVDNVPMLDGGVADSIPFERCLHKGYDKALVILTRNKGYRKKVSKLKLPPFVYRRFPKIRNAFNRRSEMYNKQLERLEQLERDGKLIVIRPSDPINISRIEQNTEILVGLYQHGYDCAGRALSSLV